MNAFDRRHMMAALCGGAGALLSAPSAFAQTAPMRPKGELIYANPLKTPKDIEGFKLEGEALIDFDEGRMRLKNKMSAEAGQTSNFVFWCPEVFPDEVEISWNFTALAEPGLCILFFAARGILKDKDVHVLDKGIKPRAGVYEQYTQSDVSALQIAYFRRRWPEERAFHLLNLRRAPGFELLAQGADPLPDVKDATPPYRIRLMKSKAGVQFFINDLKVVDWRDDHTKPTPGAGSIGFRQMAPLVAAYSDLEVRRLPKV